LLSGRLNRFVMTKKEKLKRVTSDHPSNWLEETAKKLAIQGARKNARKVALRVLQLLRERDISQTELAERMGVSRQQVTKIVKGQENFTFETIDKLEKALNVTLMTIGAAVEASTLDVSRLTGVIVLPPCSWNPVPDLWSLTGALTGMDFLLMNHGLPMHAPWAAVPYIMHGTSRICTRLGYLHPIASLGRTNLPIVLGTKPDEPDISERYNIINEEEIDYSMS